MLAACSLLYGQELGATERPPSQNAAPQNAAPQNAAPQNAAPQNAAPQNAAPQNAAPKNAAPQNATTPGASTPQEPSVVQEVQPRGFYLRNERGDLVYVPDYPYEQFEQLLKIQRNLNNPQRPAFVMRDMAIDARVAGNQLEMDVEFHLEGRQLEGVSEGTWLRVPLRFDKAYLRKEPSFEGPGGHFLTFDEKQGGYVCWIQMTSPAMHRVGLSLLVPITRVGEESRFTLEAPSPLASTLSLRVPENPAEGTVRELTDEAGRPLAFSTTSDGWGLFSTRGIRGNVTFSWHQSRGAEERTDVRLDVLGSVIVTADELLQEVRSDGRFVVRGLGGPIESFRVRLPPGMRLRASSEPGYKVQVLPAEANTKAEGQTVEIRLDRPTSNEARVRLVTELPSNQDDPTWPLTVAKLVDSPMEFEPARYEVLDAARHRGQIDFVINGDWALHWLDDSDFPRLETTNADATGAGLTARFGYHNQNRALRVSIRQKPSRISVEPTYDIYVDPQQARLFASLVCRTSGSKAGPLAVRLPGWTVEIVSFAEVDNPLPIDTSDANPLVIPIPVEAQAAGRFSLQIEARQDLTASVVSGTSPLRIATPMVEAANPSRVNLIVSPGTVTMIPADNVLLTPRPQKMQALSSLVVPPLMSSADPPRTPAEGGVTPGSGAANGYEATLFRYRDRGAAEQAVFVGDFQVQPLSISVSVANTVTIDRRSYSVEQRFSYMVLHEAVDTLELTVPATLAKGDRGKLRILLEDQPLTPTFEDSRTGGRTGVRVRLSQPMLGPIDLRIVHPRQPMMELDADQTAELLIPLASSSARGVTNTTVIGNTLSILHTDPLRVEAAHGDWTVDEGETGPGKLVLTTGSDSGDATIKVSLRGTGLTSSAILDQVWIQTWIAGSERRDRAVFRFRTNESHMRVRLPLDDGVDSSSIELAVDHRKVTVEPPDDNHGITFTVPPSSDGANSQHVVEVWYRFTAGRPARGRMTLESASLEAVDHAQRCYWQLILPRGEVAMWGSLDSSAELVWQGWFGWTRKPLRQQADLERWIGAVRQDPIPPGTNRYLFTTFGAARQLELTTVSRSLLLLSASGIALAIGLLLIYVPALRHPAVLFVTGIALLTLAVAAPEISIQLAQAASLGVVLALSAHLFRAALLRAQTAASAVPGKVQYSDSKVMELRYPRADGSSKIKTASGPMTVQTTSAELKP